jgi:Lon protease-like protein
MLPLFPLQLVVFPGSIVPLHIFEDRYREMVGAAAADGSEFGIVLAKDGGIVNTGCTVVVDQVANRYPDGRFDVITRGRRRFEIIALDQEKPWLRGEVQYFEDEDLVPPSDDLRARALNAFVKLQGSLNQSSSAPADPANPLLSFQLAQDLEDLDFKTTLQRERSERERLRQFIKFVEEYIPRQEYAARVRRSGPQNGFGHKPASL